MPAAFFRRTLSKPSAALQVTNAKGGKLQCSYYKAVDMGDAVRARAGKQRYLLLLLVLS